MTTTSLTPTQISDGLLAPGISLGGSQFTFSVPGAGSVYPNYPSDEPSRAGFGVLNAGQASAFRQALALWDSYIAPNFTEVADNAGSRGEVRVAFTTVANSGEAGYAYQSSPTTPGGNAGDIWLSTALASGSFARGTVEFQTLVHELGHVLGLKHPFEGTPIPAGFDSLVYTIMSYSTAPVGGTLVTFARTGANSASVTSRAVNDATAMVADIAAVQALYGADTTTATGDNRYTFNQNDDFRQTIYDAGGNDTIDLSNFTRASNIDLRPGAYSDLGVWTINEQIAYWTQTLGGFNTAVTNALNRTTTYTWTQNLGIAFSTVIENAVGGAAGDTIIGNDAANRIEGLGGRDTLTGGAGADAFVYASVAASTAGAGRDVITDFAAGSDRIELAGAGGQTFIGTAAFSGAAGQVRVTSEGGNTIVELDANGDRAADLQIELSGAVALSLADFTGLTQGGTPGGSTGAATAGNDTLTSTGAADTLAGLAGDDTYVVNATGVVVRENVGEGTDTIVVTAAAANYLLAAGSSVEVLRAEAGTANINVAGNNLAQLIQGNAGNNILSGAGGADTLDGGLGDDVYRIFTTEDVIIDAGGFDTVYSSGTSYFLYGTAAIEYLSFAQQSSTEYAYMVGNGASQLIVGNYGNNILNGRGGNDERLPDTLVGLFGDDTYAIFSQGDVIREVAGQGSDVVYANASYQLRSGTEVEALAAVVGSATGAANAFTLIGNEFNQLVVGNDTANVLDGGLGNDTLIGLGGADTFAFSTTLGASNVDTVQGFVSGTDRIGLATDVFAGVTTGGITAGEFLVGSAAADADDRLVYNQTTGQLFYDADGNGAGAAVLFAQFAAGTVIAAGDFTTIPPVAALPAA